MIQITTLNVSGITPNDYKLLVPIFQNTEQSQLPDIVIVGLQEVVKATVISMIGNFFTGSGEEEIQSWKTMITNALNSINQFRRLFDREE